MRFLFRLFAQLILLLIVVLAFAPPLIGYALQNLVDVRLMFRGFGSKPKVRIISYDKGWFSSDITVAMKLDDPDFRAVIIKFGVDPIDFPPNLEITFQQHIQHGPIFYKPLAHLPSMFGIAALDRKLIILQEQQHLFNTVGLDETVWQADQAYMDFLGQISEYIELSNYHLLIPGKKSYLQFDSLTGELSQWLGIDHAKGNITVNNFSFANEDTSITLPSASIFFDIQKDANGLWVGSHALSLSQIILRNTVTDYIAVDNLKFVGVENEADNLLDAEKDLSLQKIQIDDNTIGPVHLQVSANRINSKAITNLIDAYQVVARQGELYESQLRDKLFSLIPTAISPGASVQIDKLEFATPDGQFRMSAKLSWPSMKFVAPESLSDMLQSAYLNGALRVSSKLASKILGFSAKLTYIYQIPEEARPALLEQRDDIRLTTQLNTYLIIELVKARVITHEEAKALIKMIRANVPLDEYAYELKTMLFDRKISLAISYLLDWQYAVLTQQIDTFNQALMHYQKAAEQEMNADLSDYIKQGYVKKEDDDYIVDLVRENGVIKLNGRVFESKK